MNPRITCYLSTNAREQEIGRALKAGAEQHGARVTLKLRSDFWDHSIEPDTDIVCVVGVKSKKMFDACTAQGKTPLIIDKGYFGRGEMYRMSLGAYQPPYLDQIAPNPVRLYACGVTIRPRISSGHALMYVGSSQKYCNFHELGDNNVFSRAVVSRMTSYWTGPVIYRPKPSWWMKFKAGETRDDLEDLPRVEFSGHLKLFNKELQRCWAVVTHGSNGAAEALAAGIPVIMLSPEGTSPVWKLCEHDLARVATPYFPSTEDRLKVLSAMAWCQFSIAEMASGFAWNNLSHWYKEGTR